MLYVKIVDKQCFRTHAVVKPDQSQLQVTSNKIGMPARELHSCSTANTNLIQYYFVAETGVRKPVRMKKWQGHGRPDSTVDILPHSFRNKSRIIPTFTHVRFGQNIQSTSNSPAKVRSCRSTWDQKATLALTAYWQVVFLVALQWLWTSEPAAR